MAIIGRKHNYYKYQYRTFSQPVLTENGLLGGGTFAVSGDVTDPIYQPYQAFDGTDPAWIAQLPSPEYIIYNPNPLKISKITVVNPVNFANAYAVTSGSVYGSNNNSNWTLLTNFQNSVTGNGQVWSIDIETDKYFRYYKIVNSTHLNDWGGYKDLFLVAEEQISVEGTSSDYDYMVPDTLITYSLAYSQSFIQDQEYPLPNTYHIPIVRDCDVTIELIGGGGGAGISDGGIDQYSDTSWGNHYAHDGAGGGYFKGTAHLSKGVLDLTVGSAGIFGAGKGNTSGHGGDSYAVFTPSRGAPIEIARASGGHSGYPDGSSFYASVPGGSVTYNSAYIDSVIEVVEGTSGNIYPTVIYI